MEDPANEPKKDMFMLTVDPEDAPNEPELVLLMKKKIPLNKKVPF